MQWSPAGLTPLSFAVWLSSVVSRVLEVTDLPEGISRLEAEKLFNQLSLCGAKIQWLKDPQGGRAGGCGSGPGAGPSGTGMGMKGDSHDPAHLYTVVAVFPSTMAAQSASFKLNNSGASLFKLRAAKKNYDLRVLERASSQWEERRTGGKTTKEERLGGKRSEGNCYYDFCRFYCFVFIMQKSTQDTWAWFHCCGGICAATIPKHNRCHSLTHKPDDTGGCTSAGNRVA